MYYKLNIYLKNFGVNATPSITFLPKDEKEIKNLLDGFKPVLRNYDLYKYEIEYEDNVTITKRTEIHKINILNLLPEK